MSDLTQAKAILDGLTADIIAFIDGTWERIAAAEQQLVDDWLTLTSSEQTRRIRALQRLAADLMTQVEARARGEVSDLLTQAYEHGASQLAAVIGLPSDLTAEHSTLLTQVSSDTYLDVLAATTLVRQSTKEMVRHLAQQAATLRFTGLRTAEQAGRELAKAMAGSGITAIVYRDGSRHGLGDYADMLMRTKTAEVFQVGGFDQADNFGVTFMELLDNPSCGLSSHDDERKANGLILPLAEARKYPLSHPRCVRVTTPRVDVRTAEQAAAASPSATAAQNEVQGQVERRRAAAARSRAAARSERGVLNTRSGAASSAAARRNAARVARRQGAAQ